MTTIAERIAALDLPPPLVPKGNYVPWLFSGRHLYISGQVSVAGDKAVLGVVGRDVDLAGAQAAARLCGLNLLAQIAAALDGDFARVARVVKLNGFVQAEEGFTDIPLVMNGCSDLMVEAFGERGLHTRSSVGVKQLPRGSAVEVDAVIEVTG